MENEDIFNEAVVELVAWADKELKLTAEAALAEADLLLFNFRILLFNFRIVAVQNHTLNENQLKKLVFDKLEELNKIKPVPEEIKNKFLLCFL